MLLPPVPHIASPSSVSALESCCSPSLMSRDSQVVRWSNTWSSLRKPSGLLTKLKLMCRLASLAVSNSLCAKMVKNSAGFSYTFMPFSMSMRTWSRTALHAAAV